jgi:methylthioribose-1-phosphate isomerase
MSNDPNFASPESARVQASSTTPDVVDIEHAMHQVRSAPGVGVAASVNEVHGVPTHGTRA